MVNQLKNEEGGEIISSTVQKTIQSIREIVGNYSDFEIYNTLQESNMDPNETAQKLLNQDTFHVVRRRRDKKKENAGYNAQIEPRKHTQFGPGMKFNGSERNVRRGSYRRSPAYDSRVNREFRVVRDNRVNQNAEQESKASTQVPLSTDGHGSNNVSGISSSVVPNNQRHRGGRYSQNFNGVRDFRPKMARVINSDAHNGHYEKKSAFTSSESQATTVKSNNTNSLAGNVVSSNDVGVYASASDPIHNPSDSRSSAAIGGKRRDLGVVGSRRQFSDSSSKQSIQQNNSNVNPVVGASTTESFQQMSSTPRNDQTHTIIVDSVMVGSNGSRSSNHFGTRSHPHSVSHQKGALPGKEWKPKTNQKSSASGPGVIGSPVKSVSQVAYTSKNPETGIELLQEKLSQVNIQESQNVIIAQHIRVPENDRCRLTFGAFGLDSDDNESSVSAFQAADSIKDPIETSPSKKQLHSAENHAQNSGSSSPSGPSSEDPSPDNKDSSGISETVDFNQMGLVHNSPSLTASKSQEHRESTELPNFSAYDQQPTYDMLYFRPSSIDDAVRGSGLPSPQEALQSHVANSVPASVGMLQQQQPPMAQMYPPVHVSHFANVIPYRQYLPPLYVPPMVPGFSGNPGYPHLSNGSSYVLMPGAGSHIPENSLKYGVQQFKPFPIGSPTGFGNLANPSGYAINAPGVVGGLTGLDDSSRLKYKDNNLYVPNPQAETSEVWIQNHRELSGMQSNPYYNMQGQTAHPAFLQSHTGHASFNGAGVAQSSQMQFPGMYPPQPAGIPNAHHLGGGNIRVGVAPPTPGAQVGAYQQPQMSHLNWTTNF